MNLLKNIVQTRLLTLLQIVLPVITPPRAVRATRPSTCPLCHAPIVVRAFIAPFDARRVTACGMAHLTRCT